MINLRQKNKVLKDLMMIIIIIMTIEETEETKEIIINKRMYMLKKKKETFNYKYLIKIVENNIAQRPKNKRKKYQKT